MQKGFSLLGEGRRPEPQAGGGRCLNQREGGWQGSIGVERVQWVGGEADSWQRICWVAIQPLDPQAGRPRLPAL